MTCRVVENVESTTFLLIRYGEAEANVQKLM